MRVWYFANNIAASFNYFLQVVHKCLTVKSRELITDKIMRLVFYGKWRQYFKVAHKERTIIQYIKIVSFINMVFAGNGIQACSHHIGPLAVRFHLYSNRVVQFFI